MMSNQQGHASYGLNTRYMFLEFEGFSLSQEIEAEKRAVSGGAKNAASPRKETKVCFLEIFYC